MTITILSANIGVPNPIAAPIVKDFDDFAILVQQAGIVCATSSLAIRLLGKNCSATINGTVLGQEAIELGSNGLVRISSTGTVIGASEAIQSGSNSSVIVDGSVIGRVSLEFGSSLSLAAGGSITNDGGGVLAFSETSLHIAGVVRSDDVAVKLAGEGSTLDVSGLLAGNEFGVLSSGFLNRIHVSGAIAGFKTGAGLSDSNLLSVSESGMVGAKTGVSAGDTASNVKIINGGIISGSFGRGISLDGKASSVVNGGTISGTLGVEMSAADGSVRNAGVIQGSTFSGVVFAGADSSLDNRGEISGESSGLAITGIRSEIRNHGTITGHDSAGISSQANDTRVVNDGLIKGLTGVSITGLRGDIVNSGTIAGAGRGVGLNGDNAHLVNSGLISARSLEAVNIIGSGNRVESSGLISSFANGLRLTETSATGRSFLDNDGSISGSTGVVALGRVKIDNSGEISGTAAGVTIESLSSVLRNSGHVDGNIVYKLETGASNTLVNIDGGSIDGDINDAGTGILKVVNEGVITGNISLNAGDDSYDGSLGYTRGNVSGGFGADSLTGGTRSDRLFGYEGNDTIDGGAGDDRLAGDGGIDTVRGGAGDDLFFSSAPLLATTDGDDFYFGGEGTDTLSFSGFSKAVTVNIAASLASGGSIGNDVLHGIENVEGSSGSDSMTGDAASNALTGNDGSDRLVGAAGDDSLAGGNGGDRITGGQGKDFLDGGTGSDRFVYSSLAESVSSDFDVVLDFSKSDGDKFDFLDVDANALLTGNQTFTFIGTLDFTGAAGELRTFTRAGTTVLESDSDGDAIAEFTIVLKGIIALDLNDFLLVT